MASSLLAPEDIMLPPSPPEYADEYADEPSSTNGSYAAPLPITGLNSPNDHTATATTKTTTLSLPPTLNILPKPHSSLGKTHLRSRSLASPAAPSMARAHSSPGPDSRGRYGLGGSPVRPSSPQGSSIRRQSPLRVSVEDSLYPHIGTLNISETISEHPELQITTPRSRKIQLDVPPSSPLSPGIHNTFPRTIRRRPSSPLHPGSSSPNSAQSSPVVFPTKFNESYPGSFSSISSMPSTPSSIRSRSPSISSLETIPDIPDAEAAAIEADRIAKLKAAADKADAAAANKDLSRRRSAIDVSGSSSPIGNPRFGIGSYGGRPDKRKRWSVCGAEGRQDLDLETIWED
ncbi:hypothetical protein AJ79_07601 [Helicocarpus griseus UAMH5409]|uniref:Basic proline-rich protein n=1 Tax=Helicocarpus griseus UAMH5409 TaxID=1447875 RepID=A0A2B7X1C6_9EURO|nr:hypothetical protein AJ79_07601 [Helicocarpus griseus UAMH5409]